MEKKKYCKNCGAELKENDKFCTNCGTPVNDTNESDSEEEMNQIESEETFDHKEESAEETEEHTSSNDAAFNGQSSESQELTEYQNVTGDQQQYAESQPGESGNGGKNRSKKSQRWIIVMIVLAVVIFGSVIIYFLFFQSTPEQAVEDYLSNGANRIEQNLEEQYSENPEYTEIYQAFWNTGDAVQYEFQDTVKDGDTATVKVDFTFNDHTNAMNAAIGEVFSTSLFSAIFGGNIDEDETLSLLVDAVNKAAANEEIIVSTKMVNFPCTRTNGQWEVDVTDDLRSDLNNIYTGNAFKTILSLEDNEETPDTSEGQNSGEQHEEE